MVAWAKGGGRFSEKKAASISSWLRAAEKGKATEGPEDLCPGHSSRPASRQSSCFEGFSIPISFFAAPFHSVFSSVLLGGFTVNVFFCCLCFTEMDVDRETRRLICFL